MYMIHGADNILVSLHVTHMHMIPIIYVMLGNGQSLSRAMLIRDTEQEKQTNDLQ